MSTRQSATDPERLRALGKFLAARRAEVAPAADLPPGHRRVKGLRREEVAARANVSADWYRKVEQGSGRISAELLTAIAKALELTPDQTAHAFTLANLALPSLPSCVPTEEVTPGLRNILCRLGPCPVFVQGRRWDILEANDAARDVFLDDEELPESDRNIVWLMFTSRYLHDGIVDWEGHAKRVLANFRVSWGYYVGDPRFDDLIKRLQEASPEFETWWNDNDLVGARQEGVKEFLHPLVGKLTFLQTTLHVFGEEDPKVVVYTPVDRETEERLVELRKIKEPERREGEP